jgi:hypothetical protein
LKIANVNEWWLSVIISEIGDETHHLPQLV